MKNAFKKLDEIFDLIPEDSDVASALLDKFKGEFKRGKDKLIQAKMDLASLVLANYSGTFASQQIDDKALLSFFENHKKYDEATVLLIAKAKHFYTVGQVPECEKCLTYIKEHLLDKVSEQNEVSYLVHMAQVCITKNEWAQRLYLGMEAMDKIKLIEYKDGWWYANYIAICTIIASAHQRYDQFDDAWSYLQDALDIVNSRPVSKAHRIVLYRFLAVFHNLKMETDLSVSWYEKMLELLKQDEINVAVMLGVYFNLGAQHFWLYNQTPVSDKKKRADVLVKLEAFANDAEKYLAKLPVNYYRVNVLFTQCRVQILKKNYSLAQQQLDEAELMQKEVKHVQNDYQLLLLRHRLYYNWGIQKNDPDMLARAYEYLEKCGEQVNDFHKKSTTEKLDAIKMNYELKERKMHEELLQQENDSLSREMQLTAINLQEKVMLLDELKSFFLSLKKGNSETSRQITAAVKKIDSVRITEQEKNMMQVKMSPANQQFIKRLAARYPMLSNLSINMCLLFVTGLNDKELSRLYGQTEKSYEQHRYRIKKKLKLGAKDNLVQELLKLI